MNRNCYDIEETKVKKFALMKIAINEIIAIQVNYLTIDKNHMYIVCIIIINYYYYYHY